MEKNVGKVDSYIRYALGIAFLVLAYLVSWWFLLPAVIAIVTGAVGVCGLYRLFGINTCKVKS